MADPKVKTILELQTPDGKIAELPIYEDDTPETISAALKKNNFDPSKYSKEIGKALQPVDMGASMAGEPPSTGVKLPERVSQLKSYAEQFNPNSKEYKKAMDAYSSERDDFLKLNPEPKEKAPANSAEAAKLLEIVTGGVTNLNDLESEVNKGNRLIGQALPWGIGDRKTDYLLNDITDRIGRLRSGGAITEGNNGSGGELARFEKYPPGPLDFSKEDKLYKIQKAKEQFSRIGETLKGGPEQYQSYLQSILSKSTGSPTSPQPQQSAASGFNVDQDAIKAALARKLAQQNGAMPK